MNNPIFTTEGAYMLARWIHYMAGVTWIGILYYFNFVQGAYFAETDAASKSAAIRGLVPKALWWFRYGALLTWLSGVYMLWHKDHYAGHAIWQTSFGVWILLGAAMGTIMAFNVWFVIWPAQQVVIASAKSVAAGSQADPTATARGARATVASRTNTFLSIPLLFLMGAASHLALPIGPDSKLGMLAGIFAIILAAIEANALVGKTGPLTTVKGVIHCGLALTVVFYIIASALV